MMASETLLLEAFHLPPDQAEARWKQWRETVDVDQFDHHALQTLPLLAHRLNDWLEADPAQRTILGLFRRAWTRNQVALGMQADVARCVQAAGVACVGLVGPPAWALLYAEQRSIRVIDTLEILVAREDALAAVNALLAAGWLLVPTEPLPEGPMLNWRESVWLIDNRKQGLKVSWRLLPCPQEVALERESQLGPLTPIDVQGATLHLPAPEQMMLRALAEQREPHHLDWRWDALALAAWRELDWALVTQLLPPENAVARQRLQELAGTWRLPASRIC